MTSQSFKIIWRLWRWLPSLLEELCNNVSNNRLSFPNISPRLTQLRYGWNWSCYHFQTPPYKHHSKPPPLLPLWLTRDVKLRVQYGWFVNFHRWKLWIHDSYILLQLSRCTNNFVKIWGFHGADYEECRLLGSYAERLVRTDVSEERIACIIRVTRIGQLGTTFAVTTNRSMLQGSTMWERKH
jgi:hypothetical protein